MRVIKPNWVEHAAGEKQTKSPIYSISVHPDGTRLATGGQDNKVKIWSTVPILDDDAANDEKNPRLLCTMSAHTGPVLTVRWAHHGRYLASGSDDTVLLIWDLDVMGGGRVFGSEEVNVENWKAKKRLVGHEADVVDCAWSRDDAMLASVGLDSKIVIWDGWSFEKLRTIDAHNGFVKGVTWDPVGNYLATQSDDKTVRIWNTETWQCVETVSKPFEMSPQSTFFRRLSWSPDGAFIAASNAMNGPVFVAAVIEREGWQSEISFVGHENTIQVAAFNPRLFFLKDNPKDRANASCMVALGADDYCISIWRNTYHKPLVVMRDVFARALLDLCWANDGLTLYGCSADGTIMAARFTGTEFPELGGPEMTDDILNAYDYKPSGRPRVRPMIAPPAFESNAFAAAKPGAEEVVNVIIPRKAPKKPRRVALDRTMGGAMGGSQPMSNGGSHGGGSSSGRAPLQRPIPVAPSSPHSSMRAHPVDAFAAAELQPLTEGSGSAATARMFEGAHRAFGASERSDLKRKAMDDDYSRPAKGRTMGTSRSLGAAQEIRAPHIVLSASSGSGHTLPVPTIQNVLRVQQDDGVHALTATNTSDDEDVFGHMVTYANTKENKDIWVDFMPSPILAIAATPQLCAAACEDCSVRIFATSGRSKHAFTLPAAVSELVACKDFLAIVTVDCNVMVIDTRKDEASVVPISISHLLNAPRSSSAKITLTEVMLRSNGCPIVITSMPAAWAYDSAVKGWVQIASAWWGNSPLNEVRTRHSRGSAHAGPLAEIEQRVAAGCTSSASTQEKPQWWKEYMSASHYESRMRACRLLDSKDEYKHWLREYSKLLGEENFRERAEELITELTGPLYQLSHKTFWEPTLMGAPKREYAAIALGIMKNSVALGQYAMHVLKQLKDVQAEEARWARE